MELIKIRNGREARQLLTPTIIKHEYAHHLITRMTGALRSVNFDCFKLANQGLNEEIHCLDKVKDAERRFEGSLIEGLADAMAAYQTGTPLFGYYDPEGKSSGAFAYDISRRDERVGSGDIKRNVVGRLFWDIYKNICIHYKDSRRLYLWKITRGSGRRVTAPAAGSFPGARRCAGRARGRPGRSPGRPRCPRGTGRGRGNRPGRLPWPRRRGRGRRSSRAG